MNYRKIISVYQVLGGLAGLYINIQILTSVGFTYVSFFIVFILLYLIMILAGISLFLERKNGRTLSIFIQILQLVQFSLGGFQFKFGAGMALFVGFKDVITKFNINFLPLYAESSWAINDKELYLYVNLIAILIIRYLITIPSGRSVR